MIGKHIERRQTERRSTVAPNEAVTSTFGRTAVGDMVQHEGVWLKVVHVKPRDHQRTVLELEGYAHAFGSKNDPIQVIKKS